MKVLISDKISVKGVDVLKSAPGIDVDVKTDLTPDDLKSIIICDDGFEINGKIWKTRFSKTGKLFYWMMIIPLGLLALISVSAIQTFIAYQGIKATQGVGWLMLLAGPFVTGILLFYFGRIAILFFLTEAKTLFFTHEDIESYTQERREPESLCATFFVNRPGFLEGSFTIYAKETSRRKRVLREYLLNLEKPNSKKRRKI